MRSAFLGAVLLGTLGAAGCLESGEGDGSARGVPTWEEFERQARREVDDRVIYILDGDIPVTLDELREHYDHVAHADDPFGVTEQESIVNRVGNADDIWTGGRQLDLTYCVSNDFGGNKGRAVAEMTEATRAWEAVAHVRFHYFPWHDANCNNTNNGVVFSVRPWSGGGACAFFPSGASCVPRTLVMDFNDFDTNPTWRSIAPNVRTVGVFRHELGHILGFRHEHTRPNSGQCFEDNSWRALTPYDQGSVMHYPWCNGVTTSDLSLTAADIAGVRSLYGARHRASASGKVAMVSRIPNSLEAFWIAPNGSIQDAHWYEGMSGWNRFELAPAGSAAVTSRLTAISRAANHLELFWVAPNGSVQAAYWYEGMSGWARFELAPAGHASIHGGVIGVSRAANTMEVWWPCPNGSVQAAYWYEGGGWGRFQLSPPGSASPYATIGAASRQPSTMEIWWVAPDGSVRDAYWYEGMSGWAQYTLAGAGSASIYAGVASASRISSSLEVWWPAPNGSVQGRYWYEGMPGWAGYELAGAGSASVFTAITAVSRIANSLEVWWPAPNGSVQDRYWYEGMPGWAGYELAGAGSASTNVSLAGVPRIPNTLEILWVAPNRSVQDRHWYEGMSWWNGFELAAAGSAAN